MVRKMNPVTDEQVDAVLEQVMALQGQGVPDGQIMEMVGSFLSQVPEERLMKRASVLAQRSDRRLAAHENHATLMDRLGAPPPTTSELIISKPTEDSIDFRPDVLVCGVCGVQLNKFFDVDHSEVYVHAQSWGTYDHDPEPKLVPRGDYSNVSCDFCGEMGQLYWRFFGAQMHHNDGGMLTDMGSAWGACQTCSQYVHDNDFEGLLAHYSKVGMAFTGMPDVDATLRAKALNMWMRFLPTVYKETYVGPRREPARLNPRMMPKLQRGLLRFWRSERLLELLTTNRNLNGQTHSIPGVHCGDEDIFTVRFPPDAPVPENVWRNHTQHLAAGIEGGDLFWVSKDFTQLAIMAGKDFEKLVITREDLPSTFGFMVYEEPIGEFQRLGGTAGIRAVTWTLVPQGIWMNLYMQGEDGDPEVDVEEMRAELGYLMCPNAGGGFEFGFEIDYPESEALQFIGTIFATWFLMVQPGVTDRSTAPVDKKYARSYQRQYQKKLPDVVLVDLRKRPQRSGIEHEGHPGHRLTQRVYRRGHWKRQFYGPKRGLRKMIYVSGYIAGPEGAPLKLRPAEVKVLR